MDNNLRLFINISTFLFSITAIFVTLKKITNPWSEFIDFDSSMIKLTTVCFLSIFTAFIFNFELLSKLELFFGIVTLISLFFLIIFQMIRRVRKFDENFNKEDSNLDVITDVSIQDLEDRFKELLPLENLTISNEVNVLIEKLQHIESNDNQASQRKLQDFVNKYLTILYISLQNYSKLNKPDAESSNNLIITLKTVNAALDRILSESDEILREDINSTTSAITSLLAPKVKESPFENQKG